MASIVLISPKFDTSFWGLEHAVPLINKRASMPQAALPLLAALTPEPHTVTLVDENVESIDFDRITQADIVGITAMHCQGPRARAILSELRARSSFTVVGGPLVTIENDSFDGLADVIFLGEAEETWPRFLEEWQRGEHKIRYEQAEKSDMTRVPVPRLDLLKMNRYMSGTMQISRGCPFQCEFCDIIITFGRRPRLKTSQQVLAELEAFLQQRMTIVFVVDDNLIGNKKAIKPILRDIAEWQEARHYPLSFLTEASLDLAEDEELMELMGLAGIQAVFVGIESPNEESLLETKKYQNVREKAGTLDDRVRRIQERNLEVYAGMILGFDNDDESIFDATAQFLEGSAIAHALIGMLFALPTTPLHTRLKKEGRVLDGDHVAFGTNIVPLKMTRDELRRGFVSLVRRVYRANAFLDRLDELFLDRRLEYAMHRPSYWRHHRLAWIKRSAFNLVKVAFVYSQLMRKVPERELRREYRRRFWRLVKERSREPHIWFIYLLKLTSHFHYHTMSGELTRSADNTPAEPPRAPGSQSRPEGEPSLLSGSSTHP